MLIKEIERTPYEGQGKPEMLKHDFYRAGIVIKFHHWAKLIWDNSRSNKRTATSASGLTSFV
jgi:hypothetical protein